MLRVFGINPDPHTAARPLVNDAATDRFGYDFAAPSGAK
jgi:hypothetical protein